MKSTIGRAEPSIQPQRSRGKVPSSRKHWELECGRALSSVSGKVRPILNRRRQRVAALPGRPCSWGGVKKDAARPLPPKPGGFPSSFYMLNPLPWGEGGARSEPGEGSVALADWYSVFVVGAVILCVMHLPTQRVRELRRNQTEAERAA